MIEKDGSQRDVAPVAIRLSRLHQLFDSFDPAPFHEKGLDREAEEYIVGYVDEFPIQSSQQLVIELPPDQLTLAETAEVGTAIQNFFAYRAAEARRRLRFHFRQGRIALLIGLTFLFACVGIRTLVLLPEHGTIPQILAEGFLILGWVAMWRPLEIFLYDWWPLRHYCRLYTKLQNMPVELRAAGPS